jgi:hypothetical protein
MIKNFYVSEHSFSIVWQRKHHLQEDDLDQYLKRRNQLIKIC